jgi:hypothetical protein
MRGRAGVDKENAGAPPPPLSITFKQTYNEQASTGRRKYVWDELDTAGGDSGAGDEWDDRSATVSATSDVSRLRYTADLQAMSDEVVERTRAMKAELEERAKEVSSDPPPKKIG